MHDPETIALPSLPPGILAAVFIPASEDDVELIASDEPSSSPILTVAPLLRALTTATAAAS